MERGSSRPLSRANSLAGQARSLAPSHIKVVARFRPTIADTPSCLEELTDHSVQITGLSQVFNFDSVFGPDADQKTVFDGAIRPIVEGVLEGYNGCVLAYGQTGAGKSHTMMGGEHSERGAIPRMLDHIFAEKPETHAVRVGYLEIYNEKVRDLLDACYPGDDLRVHEVSGGGGFYVKGLTEIDVTSAAQVHSIMRKGDKNRMTAPTNMNAQSSRSHSIFLVDVIGPKTRSKLVLVDLAGSEKVAKTGARGALLEEAVNINRSLSSLGMVVNALASASDAAGPQAGPHTTVTNPPASKGHQNASAPRSRPTSSSSADAAASSSSAQQPQHIPFRDSKLTRILQDSLVGNSRTCLIVHCSPSSLHLSETVSTLRFGVRAKHVKTVPRINYTPQSSDASSVVISQLLGEQAQMQLLLLEAHEQLNRTLRNEQQRLIAQKSHDIQAIEAAREQVSLLEAQIEAEEARSRDAEQYLFTEIVNLGPRLASLH